MAKIKGLSPSKMSGSVGDYTYRQTKYGTVVSEKLQKGRKLPTLTQCHTRYQVTNLSNFGAVLLPALKKAFQGSSNEIGAFVRAKFNPQPMFIRNGLRVEG